MGAARLGHDQRRRATTTRSRAALIARRGGADRQAGEAIELQLEPGRQCEHGDVWAAYHDGVRDEVRDPQIVPGLAVPHDAVAQADLSADANTVIEVAAQRGRRGDGAGFVRVDEDRQTTTPEVERTTAGDHEARRAGVQ